MASFPWSVLGPVDKPPCNLHLPFRGLSATLFHTDGALHGAPLRVLALQVPLAFLGVRGSLQKREILTSPFLLMYTAAIQFSFLIPNPMTRARALYV